MLLQAFYVKEPKKFNIISPSHYVLNPTRTLHNASQPIKFNKEEGGGGSIVIPEAISDHKLITCLI
jgi:hypothetical protein